MSGSISAAVVEILTAAFAAANTATADPQQRVTIYPGGIQGTPTLRYVVVAAAEPVFSRGSWGEVAADGTGYVSLQYAASKPNTMASPVNEVIALARVGNLALMDNALQVTGLGPNIYLEEPISQPPEYVAVVTDRVTSEIATQFTYVASRLS